MISTDTVPESAVAPAIPADAHFMLAHPAHLIAQGFGSGLSPVMPGTVGTLFGWLSFHALSVRWPQLFTPLHWVFIILAAFLLGVWACRQTGRDLGVADHGSMVWDEIVAIWLVMLFVTPSGWMTELWAFLAFRFFDMAKPGPVRFCDRRFKGGFGVMFDDIVAAFCTLLAFALGRTLHLW